MEHKTAVFCSASAANCGSTGANCGSIIGINDFYGVNVISTATEYSVLRHMTAPQNTAQCVYTVHTVSTTEHELCQL